MMKFWKDRTAVAFALVGMMLMIFTLVWRINPAEGSAVPKFLTGNPFGIAVIWVLLATCMPVWMLVEILPLPPLPLAGHAQHLLASALMIIIQGIACFLIGKLISIRVRKGSKRGMKKQNSNAPIKQGIDAEEVAPNPIPVLLTRSVALVTAGTAIYTAWPDFGLKYLWFTASLLWNHFEKWWVVVRFPLLFSLLANPIIPAGKLIASYGLLRIRPWARRAAIILLTADLVPRLTGIIYDAVQSCGRKGLHMPEEAPLVQVVNMWPSYAIGFLTVLSMFALFAPGVKRMFEKAAA